MFFRKFYDIGSIVGALGSAGSIAGGPVGMAVSAGLQAAMGVAQMVKAGKLNKEADELEKSIVRPTYEIGQGVQDNYNIAASRVGQGLSDAARSVYEDNANRGLTTSIDAIIRGGGDVNSISDLYDVAEDDYAKVALLEEEARLKNLQMYMNAGTALDQERDKAWQLNVYNPYMDQVAQLDRMRNRAAQTGDAGRNAAMGAVNNYVMSNALKAETQDIFGRSGVRPPSRTTSVGIGSVVPAFERTDAGVSSAPTSLGDVRMNAGMQEQIDRINANPYIQRFIKRPR